MSLTCDASSRHECEAKITHTMPATFKERYPKTTAILDATEIKVNVPSSLLLQSQTYSNYQVYQHVQSLADGWIRSC